MNACIAVAGGKGGCGKTTTAVGLARALARAGLSPVVADADQEMPDLHLVSRVDRQPGLGRVAAGGDPASVAQSMPDTPSVSVLPAGDVAPGQLGTALSRVGDRVDLLLLDSPAGASRDAATPLRAADYTLLVTTATRTSLRDTTKTAAMARELDAPPLGAVVVEPPASSDWTIESQYCRRLFQCPRLERIPRVSGPPLGATQVRTAHRRLAKKVQERNI